MSRSVSAPSSVTNTSPCWNGDIVPGSTFRYGSNFSIVTRSPRSTSRRPIDAAAMPFPSDETTPPVTKMYLLVCCRTVGCISCESSTLVGAGEAWPLLVCAGKIFFRVDSGARWLGDHRDADRHAGGEWSQLLQSFDLLQGVWRQGDPPRERVTRVGVDPDVLPDAALEHRPIALVTQERDRGPREVHRATGVVGDDLDDMRDAQDLGRGTRRGCAELEAAAGDDGGGAPNSRRRDEGLVALHVEDR